MKSILAALVLSVAAISANAQVADPAVTQDNIAKTICVSGYTKKVRPSTAYTNKIKLEKLKLAGLPTSDSSKYELDHMIPLALGGAPKDPNNLKLQLWDSAKAKDVKERAMQKAVCAGKVKLDYAQKCMITDWKACKTK